jgi:hypothetical protein
MWLIEIENVTLEFVHEIVLVVCDIYWTKEMDSSQTLSQFNIIVI